tara:strand:+ start:149 stop:376 length:228 start_codon:yes stop_codon:yes gene_type:complete
MKLSLFIQKTQMLHGPVTYPELSLVSRIWRETQAISHSHTQLRRKNLTHSKKLVENWCFDKNRYPVTDIDCLPST